MDDEIAKSLNAQVKEVSRIAGKLKAERLIKMCVLVIISLYVYL